MKKVVDASDNIEETPESPAKESALSNLLKNIRFHVLSFSILFSLGVYYWAISSFSSERTQILRIEQIYALSAFAFLYFALLAGPLCYSFKFLPFRSQYMHARRAIGVSAFYFGLLHGSLNFFGPLGGFEGLGFLSDKYLLAITLSATALTILSLMAATSFDVVKAKLGYKKWKMLHRSVYVAAIFILIHALMLGTHFQDLSGLIPQIFLTAVAFLAGLEALRVDAFLRNRFNFVPNIGIVFTLVIALILGYLFFSFVPVDSPLSLGIHSQHIKLAQEAQQAASNPNSGNLPNIPGLKGDKTRRFNVQFDHPEVMNEKQNVDLKFKVNYASNGAPELLFDRVYEQPMHLIIVDKNLEYFQHLHPEQSYEGFSINTSFPHSGRYFLYTDFQPSGAIEQQFAFTLDVGGAPYEKQSPEKLDFGLTKSVDGYQVSLSYPQPLKAAQMSVGAQTLTFNIKDSNGQDVKNLKPYLASFGHLVMIDMEDHQYIHVHPSNTVAPKPDETSGPNVEFMPLGIYSPINRGIYKLFAQFNVDGKLIVVPFVVKVE